MTNVRLSVTTGYLVSKIHLVRTFLGIVNRTPSKLLISSNIVLALFAMLIIVQIQKAEAHDTIAVVQKQLYAQSMVNVCKDKENSWRNCYGAKLGDVVKNHTLIYGIQVLKEVQKIDPQTLDCHVVSHRMSAAEVNKNPKNWISILLAIDPNICIYGFMHGVIEARSAYDPTFILNADSLADICAIVANTNQVSGIDKTCAHIMGHVLLAEKYGKIPDAVAECEKTLPSLRYKCFGGLFMENYTRDNLIAHELTDRIPWSNEVIAQLEQLCNEYTGLASMGCWEEMSHLFAYQAGNDPKKVFTSCSRASDIFTRDECYRHSIPNYVLVDNQPSDALLASICELYITTNEWEYIKCTQMIIHAYIGSSPKYYEAAFRYCALIPEKHMAECYKKIGFYLKERMSPSELTQWCTKARRPYEEYCTGTKTADS